MVKKVKLVGNRKKDDSKIIADAKLSVKVKILLGATILVSITALLMDKSFSVDGTATATIYTPLSITQNTAMAFGNITRDTSAQTVTISSAGSVSCPGGYTCTGTTSQGIFDVSGSDGTANVTYTDGVLDKTGTSDTMALAVNTAGTPNQSTVTISGGTGTINVGADLSVAADQLGGSYSTGDGSGTPYTVTVAY